MTGTPILKLQTTVAKRGCNHRLVRLEYEGKPWAAQRLESSRCHIRFWEVARDKNGMCWSAPTPEMSEVCWKAYHHPESLTQQDIMLMANVVGSFKDLLYSTQAKQRKILSTMRKCLEPNAEGETPSKRKE